MVYTPGTRVDQIAFILLQVATMYYEYMEYNCATRPLMTTATL